MENERCSFEERERNETMTRWCSEGEKRERELAKMVAEVPREEKRDSLAAGSGHQFTHCNHYWSLCGHRAPQGGGI